MKILLLAFLLFATPLLAWDAQYLSPDDVLKADGSLVLTDGNSYFIFTRDGTFRSDPVDGMNGRTFTGSWTTTASEPSVFTVKAKLGWINGASAPDDYRIVFAVYRGHKRAADHAWFGGGERPKEVWEGYFLIEELVKVSKAS
jgi:hypothetical protein